MGTDAAKKALSPQQRLHGSGGVLLLGLSLAAVGEHAFALELIGRAVRGGFACSPALVAEPWLDAVRGEPEFLALLHEAEAQHRKAAAAFQAAGGPQLLPVPSA